MGSFAFTCSISGLPIHAGTPVRYLTLTQNPYNTNPASCSHSPGDRWFPRTFPLKVVYNDYGSIENIQEGVLLDIFLKGFTLDVVEKGTGDNSCHDVPVSLNMNLSQVLEALWEGRISVTNKNTSSKDVFRQTISLHPGIPTLARVQEAIKEAGYLLAFTMGDSGFMVDETEIGFVRVRASGYDNQERRLNTLQPALSQYATMITTGTGRYSGKAELLVAPKPLPDQTAEERKENPQNHYNRIFESSRENPEMVVAQAMIREDVWQALCSMTLSEHSSSYPKTCLEWKKMAREYWAELMEYIALRERPIPEGIDDKLRTLLSELKSELKYFQNYPGSNAVSVYTRKDIHGCALGTHFRLAGEAKPEGADLEEFLDTVGEMAFVQHILGYIRYQWAPASVNGPQFGEWEAHQQFHEELAEISLWEVEKETKDREEFEKTLDSKEVPE